MTEDTQIMHKLLQIIKCRFDSDDCLIMNIGIKQQQFLLIFFLPKLDPSYELNTAVKNGKIQSFKLLISHYPFSAHVQKSFRNTTTIVDSREFFTNEYAVIQYLLHKNLYMSNLVKQDSYSGRVTQLVNASCLVVCNDQVSFVKESTMYKFPDGLTDSSVFSTIINLSKKIGTTAIFENLEQVFYFESAKDVIYAKGHGAQSNGVHWLINQGKYCNNVPDYPYTDFKDIQISAKYLHLSTVEYTQLF